MRSLKRSKAVQRLLCNRFCPFQPVNLVFYTEDRNYKVKIATLEDMQLVATPESRVPVPGISGVGMFASFSEVISEDGPVQEKKGDKTDKTERTDKTDRTDPRFLVLSVMFYQ